jgi:hypothetical protein
VSGDRGHVHGVTRGCGPGPGGAAVWGLGYKPRLRGPGQLCHDPACCPVAGDRGRGGCVSGAAPGGRSVWPGQLRWTMGVVRAAAMEHRCRCGPGRPGAAGGLRGWTGSGGGAPGGRRRAWRRHDGPAIPGMVAPRPRREVCVDGAAVRPVRRLTLQAVVTVAAACPGSARAVPGYHVRHAGHAAPSAPARRSASPFIVEIPAFAETCGCYSCPFLPRKPYVPRYCDGSRLQMRNGVSGHGGAPDTRLRAPRPRRRSLGHTHPIRATRSQRETAAHPEEGSLINPASIRPAQRAVS